MLTYLVGCVLFDALLDDSGDGMSLDRVVTLDTLATFELTL
jgi:hypothetical protein